MDKLAETYQKGIAKIKAKDYQQAMAFFESVFQENAGFLSVVIMPFKYTDGKENSLYAWRAFSYGKKIEIFC